MPYFTPCTSFAAHPQLSRRDEPFAKRASRQKEKKDCVKGS